MMLPTVVYMFLAARESHIHMYLTLLNGDFLPKRKILAGYLHSLPYRSRCVGISMAPKFQVSPVQSGIFYIAIEHGPSIVDLPIKDGDFSCMFVYKRVCFGKPSSYS